MKPIQVIIVIVLTTFGPYACTPLQRYHPEPLPPAASAARLESRTLADSGLKNFMEKNLGHPLAAWPLRTWHLNELALAAYYFSPQKLNDGAIGKPYWIAGLMAEKLWKKFSLFINFENFTDTRQTRFDTIYTGSINNPVFRDIYAPVDGFVVNGGIKIKI